MRTVIYPGPAVDESARNQEQSHTLSGLILKPGEPVEVSDDAIAQRMIDCGLVSEASGTALSQDFTIGEPVEDRPRRGRRDRHEEEE